MPSPAISVFLPRPVSAAPLLCPVLLGRHLNLFALLTSQSILGKCRVHHRCGIKQQPWQAASSIGSMSRSVCSCQHCPNGRQPQWATCNSQPQRQHATANHSSNTQQPTTVATSNSQPQWQHATANHSDNKQQPTTVATHNSQPQRQHATANTIEPTAQLNLGPAVASMGLGRTWLTEPQANIAESMCTMSISIWRSGRHA